jgi:8-oxo-dGTP diphosphatase
MSSSVTVSNDKPTLVAIAVVERDGKFLVGERPDGAPLAGFAEFPGGKVDPGESPDVAAVRECAEESGLRVEVVRELLVTRHQYDHGLLEIHFFLCRPVGSSTTNPRLPFRWVDAGMLETLNFPAANAEVTALLVSSQP